MLKFKQFFKEDVNGAYEGYHPHKDHHTRRVNEFLHHLSSSTLDYDDLPDNPYDIQESEESSDIPEPKKPRHEAHPVEHILQKGQENAPQGNLYHHLTKGFHAAFPEGESPAETKRKGMEARKHFRQFMHERGGHAARNNLSLTSENGKTALSSGEGVQTIGVALAPHHSSGYKSDLCPNASSECRSSCLGFTAGGNRQYPEASFRSKLLRTQYMAEHPEHFARLMSHEIHENEKWSEKHGYKPGFRGNVTSDIHWEKHLPRSFFDRHKNTQFYDYTKNAKRLHSDLPSNYHLALSHTGTGHAESNDREAIEALKAGKVVAMVHQKGKVTPTHVEDTSTGQRWRIGNGDKDDNTFDRQTPEEKASGTGVVSGLKLKGIKNEAAGHFANKVDDDGIIRLDPRKTEAAKQEVFAKKKAEFDAKKSELAK